MFGGAFPVWFWVLYALFGLALWLGFLLALTLALTGLERRIGAAWPKSRKLGISMLLAASLVVVVLRLAGGLQGKMQVLQAERAASFDELVAKTCRDLRMMRRFSDPPETVASIELAPGVDGLRGVIGNPRQGIARFAVPVRIEIARDARGEVNVYQSDGRTLVAKGRSSSQAELRLRVESELPPEVLERLPSEVVLHRNTRFVIENLLTGQIVAHQDMPVVEFKGGRSGASCWPPDRTLDERFSGVAIGFLKEALAP